jgi:hypothetical protein
MPFTVTVTWGSLSPNRRPSIYDNLVERLGRNPTQDEIAKEWRRILNREPIEKESRDMPQPRLITRPGTLPPVLVRLDDPAESLARSVARTRPAEYPREEPVSLADILRGLD